TALGTHAGGPNAQLVKALGDALSVRRAVAAEVLCHARAGRLPPELFRLLKDPQPLVRLRVALALADRKEAEAVAALIALLTELPADQARQAEDYLLSLAEDQAPKAALGADAAARKKCGQAWADWWKASTGASMLAEVRKRSLTDVDREKVQRAVQ